MYYSINIGSKDGGIGIYTRLIRVSILIILIVFKKFAGEEWIFILPVLGGIGIWAVVLIVVLLTLM